MPRFILLLLFLSEVLSCAYSQEPDSLRKSIHQLESEYYGKQKLATTEILLKDITLPAPFESGATKSIIKKVLGWHPYWASSSSPDLYDFKALTHIAYFSYEVDTATGSYSTIHDWNSTPLISTSHLNGTKVLLTVTNFGTSRNTRILSDTTRQNTLISTLITLLKTRNGDGINFDFESVGSSQRANLVKFMTKAANSIKKELPLAEISMAAPAVDWNGSWDVKALSNVCDYLVIMGYDYYYSGSSTAGPVAPLEAENYNITRSINTYLSAGVPPEKLMLGVPWYGYDWSVTSNLRKASSTGSATARIYTSAKTIARTYGYTFDQLTKVPWVSYYSTTTWRQLWYDDSVSLALKYTLVNSKNMAGIGIWALSYDGGSGEIWRTIKRVFSPPDTVLKNMELNVYPNPVHGISRITFYLADKANVSLRIIDVTGKVCGILQSGDLDSGRYSFDINSASFGQGIYMCVLKVNKSVSTKKIIIIRE